MSSMSPLFIIDYRYDHPGYDISYKVTHLQELPFCPSGPPRDEPSVLVKFVLRYSLTTPTMGNVCPQFLDAKCFAIYISRERLLFDFWMVFVRKTFRSNGVPDVVAIDMIGQVFESAQTMQADPANAGKEILPILVELDIRTIQAEHESVDDVLKRAIKFETFNFFPSRKWCFNDIFYLIEEDQNSGGNSSLWLFQEYEVDVENCSICQLDDDDYYSLAKGVRLPCSHVYHTSCIFRWIMRKQTCPMCRCPVFSRGLKLLCED